MHQGGAASVSDIVHKAQATARGLGWFSIGLGILELVAPRKLARGLGLNGKEDIIAAYGMREIATGVGILASKDPTPWIWGRVGGDALDLGTLALGVEDSNPRKSNLALAFAAVAGVTILDLVTAQSLSAQRYWVNRKTPDYGDRTGFPKGLSTARGIAKDFETPRDMRAPEAMRPFRTA